MRAYLVITAVGLAAFACMAQDRDRDYQRENGPKVESIPAGTRIDVRTEGPIVVRDHSTGRIFPASVATDVVDPDGHILIPQGAPVEMIVQNVGEGEMAIDIDSISVRGHRYMVSAEVYRDSRRTNPNTGAYIGGGAVFGTVLGAITGGGKGAVAGAIAGAAAGGGAAILTRGREVNVPPESVLTFRLERPLMLGLDEDRGYDEDGYHYHNRYYDRGSGGR